MTASSRTSPPEANALYFGVFPPGPAYAQPKDVQQPVILDWDIAHPMMQYIRDLSLVYVAKASIVELPTGAKSLIDGNQGSLAFIVPREGYTDTVVTFPLMDGTTPNTTWFRYISFPLFILNSIQALGNVREGAGEEVAEPGARSSCTPRPTGSIDDSQLGRRRAGRDLLSFTPGELSSSTRPTRPASIWHNGSPRDCSRSRSICSTRARATWPPAGWFPKALPKVCAEAYKIKIGYNPVTGTQKPASIVERHLVVAGTGCTGGLARRVVYL